MQCYDCGKETGTKYQKCSECQRIYHKNWILNLKLWAIHQLGDKCSRCGRTLEDFAREFNTERPEIAFEFHHLIKGTSWVSGETHRTNIETNLRTKTLVKWKRENKIPEDIKLVCSICHGIISAISANYS